jgi:hypothetical protein
VVSLPFPHGGFDLVVSIAASGRFEMLTHCCAVRKGKHSWTPEIEAELLAYSRDGLTYGGYVIGRVVRALIPNPISVKRSNWDVAQLK